MERMYWCDGCCNEFRYATMPIVPTLVVVRNYKLWYCPGCYRDYKIDQLLDG